MFKRFSIERFLPYESHFLEIGPYRMHYYDVGADAESVKPTVLLLHGNPTWSFYYRNLIAALKDNCRVISVDHLGCGLSDRPRRTHFRASDRVEHLEVLIAALNLERFSLVMHDWGGPIGTYLAVRNVTKIDRLIYLNTTLTQTESLPGVIRLAATPFIGKALTKYSARFINLATDFGVTRRLPWEVKLGYLYPYRTMADRASIWDFVADIPFHLDHPSYTGMLEMASQIPNLRNVPVLIVWGLRDPCFHRKMLSQVAGHFPQAKVIEIADASHLVLEDSPKIVCNAIREFMTAPLNAEPTAIGQAKLRSGLYAAFSEYAGTHLNDDAVIVPFRANHLPTFLAPRNGPLAYRHINYAFLAALINQYQRGLSKLGLEPGNRVIMLTPPGVEFLALSYAVMARGAVPVFLDPGMGLENLVKCIGDCSADAVIGSPKAHLLRLLHSSVFKKLRFHVTTSDYFSVGGSSLGFLKRFSSAPLDALDASPESTALVAFTSGATGTPKGVVFTNQMLSEQLKIFRHDFAIRPGGVDIPLLPIFSLFGLALGVCSVIPPLDPGKPLAFNPADITGIIQELSVSSSFGSPTLWSKISEHCIRHQTTLPSLRQIFMAGCAVPLKVIECVSQCAPNATISTPYGATEALPVTLAQASELASLTPQAALSGEMGTPVGKAVTGVAVRIVERSEHPIATLDQCRPLGPREIGEILVSGANISSAYLNRPDANLMAKIAEEQGVWHRMGDVGYLDEQGMLYYCGRKSHIVECKGRVFYSVPIESIFDRHPRVRRSALVALHGNKDVGLVVEPFPEYWPSTKEQQDAFVKELAAIAGANALTNGITQFFFHPSFPVDARHNAKIFRDKLGEWASKQCRSEQRPFQARP